MGRRNKGDPVHGWLVLDKPAGRTSAWAVGAARRLLNANKAGHAGTLDPLATGVLPIAFGEATKTVPYIQDGRKAYAVSVRWGESRDTDDAEGSITGTSPIRPDFAAIQAVLPRFEGEIDQIPPDYSAVLVDGQRAYDMARKGEVLALKTRRVVVERFALVGLPTLETADFLIECGKGTYVRSLVRDLAAALGALGHVTALRRTRVGPFTESAAISLDTLADLVHSPAPVAYLHPVETALADIPALPLTDEEAARLRSGQRVRVPNTESGPVFATAGGHPIAVANVVDGEVQAVRVFNL